jgi:hypothetical protein
MRIRLLTVAVVSLFLSAPAAPAARAAEKPDLRIAADAGPNPWTSLSINNDPKNFQFAIVTDRTGGHRPGVFEDAVKKLNLLQPEFVMSVGDLIEGYTRNEKEVERQWAEFASFTAKLKMPFFYVPGNHDLSNEMQHRKWAERFGRKYYHFVYRDVLFLCLNSEDPQRQIGPEQLAYIDKTLEENAGVRWTLVFFHQPLWIYEQGGANNPYGDEGRPVGWAAVEKLLRANGRQFTVFAGHFHQYIKEVRNDRRFIVLASTGGASQLRGLQFGEFDHVAWVTMTDDGPLVANLLLSGIWDENVATTDTRKRVRELTSAARVIAPPIRDPAGSVGGGSTFAATTHQVKLVNDANVPLAVAARFRGGNDDIRPDPFAFEETVDPNSVKLIDLKLEPRRADLRIADIEPLFADVTFTYDTPEVVGPHGPVLKIQQVLPIAVDQILPAPRRTEPVAIDGRHDDWPNLKWPYLVRRPTQIRGNVAAWKNHRDASFGFATAHDEKFVYVAVDVIDERIIPATAASTANGKNFMQDGVEIRIDARLDPKRSQNRHDEEGIDFLLINVCPGESPDSPYVYERDGLPPGTQIACREVRDGYNVEVAIPIGYFTDRSPPPAREFRLNIAVNDRDTPGGSPEGHSQIWWRPDWRTDETYDGSGTFRRE